MIPLSILINVLYDHSTDMRMNYLIKKIHLINGKWDLFIHRPYEVVNRHNKGLLLSRSSSSTPKKNLLLIYQSVKRYYNLIT